MHLLEFFAPALQPPLLFRQIYRSVITKSHLSTLTGRTARAAISGGSHCFDGCGVIIHSGGGDCGVVIWHAFGNLMRL
nr:hypothetical protein [Tanacetum cinerariifolium]